MPAPIIKWVGGKSRLVPEIKKRLPSTFGDYYEPFAGGAALFFDLQPKKAYLSDMNAGLMRLYYEVLVDVNAVIGIATSMQAAFHSRKGVKAQRAHYELIRDSWNHPPPGTTEAYRAAMFLFLNRTCFNGLWRENQKGEFNVPMGRYDKPTICYPHELRDAARVLRNAHTSFRIGAFHAIDPQKGDLVYFDPPYDPLTTTSSFSGYAAGGFDRDDQAHLAYFARYLAKKGVHVVLSNNDTPFIRKLYKGWKLERVACGRSINSDPKKRGAVHELLITAKAV